MLCTYIMIQSPEHVMIIAVNRWRWDVAAWDSGLFTCLHGLWFSILLHVSRIRALKQSVPTVCCEPPHWLEIINCICLNNRHHHQLICSVLLDSHNYQVKFSVCNSSIYSVGIISLLFSLHLHESRLFLYVAYFTTFCYFLLLLGKLLLHFDKEVCSCMIALIAPALKNLKVVPSLICMKHSPEDLVYLCMCVFVCEYAFALGCI